MEEKDIKQEELPVTPHEDDKKREIIDILNDLLPEEEHSEDVDAMMHKYIDRAETYKRENEEMNARISEAISEEPAIANAFVAMVNGGKREAARTLVRYLGREFFTAEEGTPEFDEFKLADEEFRKEQEALRLADEEFNKNFDDSWALIEPFCKKNNIDPEQFEDNIWNRIVEPLLQGKMTEETLMMMKKALDYDKDTEDAFAAGEIKGRNENINNMRRMQNDGMPKGLGTQAVQPETKRRGNSLIEDALRFK